MKTKNPMLGVAWNFKFNSKYTRQRFLRYSTGLNISDAWAYMLLTWRYVSRKLEVICSVNVFLVRSRLREQWF
jgi:hypothetical protein